MKPLFLVALLLASTAGAQVQKWEYADLKIFSRNDVATSGVARFDASKVSLVNYYWHDKNNTRVYAIGDKDLKTPFNEFARQITGAANKTIGMGVEFQNLLGLQGWEMVSYTIDDTFYSPLSHHVRTETFFYKRIVQ